MNRLQKKLCDLKAERKKALVAFLTAGYPDLDTTRKLVPLLEENGVDIIELGVPFSDPVADGPTIQFSSEEALRKGVHLDQILSVVGDVRKKTEVPLLLMSYLNPLFSPGINKTAKQAKAKGVDGFIIPDLIPEESADIKQLLDRNDLSLVYLAAPNTPAQRLSSIDKATGSFVYIVSLMGVTGKRTMLPSTLKEFLSLTKEKIKHPRFLGFGISHPDHIANVKDYVDGVIVGSAFIEIIRQTPDQKKRKKKLAAFVRSLRTALDK